ncbi:DUF3489 domain-containing protein [Humitalea sp. 24SJ18S-53]|uniref:DUF3489 domain-containing protein n=1 Tax=Humitalea sp. 24SJ18S-53 TaxID=3422307 RepID=UPI003D674A7B
MTKQLSLSVAQVLILSTAAQRPDHMVLPFPSSLRARGASQHHLVTSLIKLSFIEEVLTLLPALSWRQDEQGLLHALRITAAGLAAVGIDAQPLVAAMAEVELAPIAPIAAPVPHAPAAPQAVAPGGKLGRVLEAAQAEDGATLGELILLTGWLPHTTRAALTRLRQRGFAFELRDIAGRKAYRLSAGAGA